MTAEVVLRTDEVSEEEWLDARRAGITGSDVLKAIGVEPSRTALWVAKTEGVDLVEETEAMRWGHRLEPVVAQAWSDETGIPVVKSNVLLRSMEHPWALVTPDYDAADGNLLEIKTVGAYLAHEWGDDADPLVPLRTTAQALWQLAVSGKEKCHIAALIGGNRLVHRSIDRDDQLIDDLLMMAGGFWKLVEEREMPPADASDAATNALNYLFPNATSEDLVELDGDAVDAYNEWLLAKSEKALAEKVEQAAANTLRALIKDHAGAAINGAEVIRWREHTTKRLDTAALKEAHPDLVEQFMSEQTVRPLRSIRAKG